MHQTFYIDVDEEMSSVIDRLNKSMSMDNYFVVPKRALFLQSIVNLKILKREADKMSKRVIIVTQDETVISMAERCGISTRETLDGVEAVSDAYLEHGEDEEVEIEDEPTEEEFEEKMTEVDDKQVRLKNLGTGDFYHHGGMDIRTSAKEVKKPLISRIAKTAKVRPQKIILAKTPKAHTKESVHVNGVRHIAKAPAKTADTKNIFKNDLDPRKAQTLEKMFSYDNHVSKNESRAEKTKTKHIGSGKVKKVFALFMVLCILVFVGVAAYIYGPSANVVIKTDVAKKKIDTQIIASNEKDLSGQVIPLKIIDKEDELSYTYEIKGAGQVAGKKAKGTVVIYNEYSSEPQTLIATTRLETENGKIFRLVKNVVIPGYTTVGGQIKPGAIQAEIVADQAGEDYNVDKTKFTIPGFSGGPKFDKFYATNDAAFTGGSSSGEAPAASGKVTQTDIDSAKQKAEAAFKEKVTQEVANDLSQGEVALEQAQRININKSSTSVKVGTLTDSIVWTVSGNIRALVFDESDIKKVMLSQIKNDDAAEVKNEISKIDYGSVEPDFDKPSLNVRVYSEIISTPVLNIEQIKKEILGKSDNQLVEILRKYSAIKSADVEFSPSFMTRVPTYTPRVFIEIQNEAQ